MQLVRKEFTFENIELKMDDSAGTFEGYASRFGGTDTAGDTILAGAFDYSLRKFGKPRMFFNHQWDLPIGKFSKVNDDGAGLFVKGEFTPGMQRAQEVRAAMKHGTIIAMSIGGFVKDSDTETKVDGGQVIKHFTKLLDISPVVFPADEGAQIDMSTVKGQRLTRSVQDIQAGLVDLQNAITMHSKNMAADRTEDNAESDTQPGATGGIVPNYGQGLGGIAEDEAEDETEDAQDQAILDSMVSSYQKISGEQPAVHVVTLSAMSSVRELERSLRDAGLTKSEAATAIARMKAILGRGDPAPRSKASLDANLDAVYARIARMSA